MLTRLDHVVVAVRDLAAASASYAQLLGRRPSWCGEHAALGTANALFRLDNTYLELLAPAGAGPLAELLRGSIEARGEGLFALAFATHDADACAKLLRERGLGASAPADGRGREATSRAERRWRNVYLPESDTRGVRIFAIQHLSPEDALLPAPPVRSAESAVSGLDHVVVTSSDAEAARALYGEQLGIRLALDRSFEERGVRLLFFRIAGVSLEIAARLDEAPRPDAPDRLWGLAWRVPDLAAARARVADEGLDVSELRAGRKSGTRVCTVRSETHGVATLLIGPEALA